MGAAKKTTDHDEIRRWVETHGGHPATVKRTRSARDVGLIRVDFPGYSGEKSLEPISWDDWFEKFDEQELAFLYQEGPRTNFNKLVRRTTARARPSTPPKSRRRVSKPTRASRTAAGKRRATAGRG